MNRVTKYASCYYLCYEIAPEYMACLTFTTAQEAADWIAANRPGVAFQWEVRA